MTDSLAARRAPFAEVQVGGTKLALLKDGLQTYPAMLAAIASAQSTLCVETYILVDDTNGRRFIDALKERAQAGVQVNLIFDGWGSSFSAEAVLALKLSGVRVLEFRPVRFAGRFRQLFARMTRRNHRKSIIVDGKIAFTGGLNLSNHYAAIEDGGDGWRDTHVRIEGPPALELERLFLHTWKTNKGSPLDDTRYRRPPTPPEPGVRIIGNDFRSDRRHIRKAYVNAFTAAKKTIALTHAYFLPTGRTLRALLNASRRGVKVSVILAAATDVGAVLWAARGLYPRLLKAGVKVYEWDGRILHAKTAVVDGRWATVGSTNLDALSLRMNLEVNAVVEDAAFASAVEKMFREDLVHCREITREHLLNRTIGARILSWFAFQFRNWL